MARAEWKVVAENDEAWIEARDSDDAREKFLALRGLPSERFGSLRCDDVRTIEERPRLCPACGSDDPNIRIHIRPAGYCADGWHSR